MWPPAALGLPFLVGLILTWVVGDPFEMPRAALVAGVVLGAGFVVWNGWALALMASHRTAILPGGATRVVLDRGPFAFSRNPLYLGLIALTLGLGLLWPSVWSLVLQPIGVALLTWGAIVPEEAYLRARFGARYDDYAQRVRRWL